MFFLGKYDIVSVSEQEQAELVQCERRTAIMIAANHDIVSVSEQEQAELVQCERRMAIMIQIIIVKRHMGGFPSGQRGQTVNLLQLASVVRIHLRPLMRG